MSEQRFVKLYASILQSSIWLEPSDTFRTWIMFLALSDLDGHVAGSTRTLAVTAGMNGVSEESFHASLRALMSPDEGSSDGGDGVRIRKCPPPDGGYEIVNYKRYFERRSAAQKRKAAEMRDYRAKKKASGE